MNAEQLARFERMRAVVAAAPDLDRQLGRHAASTPRIAAISCGPASRCTAATRSAIGRTRWRRSSTLTAPILQLREIGEPQTVGYGATYVANPPARLAVVGIGYADGYPRSLGNAGTAAVQGRRVPVVGRVSMDLICVDVGALPRDAGSRR